METFFFREPVELRIDDVREEQAVVSVITSNSTGWSNYTVKLIADNNASVLHQNIQTGNATKIDLAQLDPYSVYRVQVTPVQDGEELERCTIYIDFRTMPSEWCCIVVNVCLSVARKHHSLFLMWSTRSVLALPISWHVTRAWATDQGLQMELWAPFHRGSGSPVLSSNELKTTTNFVPRLSLILPGGQHSTPKWPNESAKQTEYSIYIAAHPSFTTRPPGVIYFVEGGNATIECSASGAPRPTVQWTRSVSPLPQGRSQQKDGRLNIIDMKTQESGNYT